MKNYFLIVGPEKYKKLLENKSICEILNTIASNEFPFISRGDESGTHSREKSLWKGCKIENSGKWYLESGSGMIATLRVANEKQGFTLSDTSTYSSHRKELQLYSYTKEDPLLLNIYSIILINPKKFPHVQFQNAEIFVTYILKGEGKTVYALKHAKHLSLSEKDDNILKYSEKYMITSDEAAVLYIPSFLHFLQMMAFLHCDYLIIEGFKEQEFMPRILCWKDENEKKELASEMDIEYCGPGEWKSAAKIDEFIKAIETRAFLLLGIDCGKCECKTCKKMAKQILVGNKSLMDCVSINVDIKVTINGNPIAISPFIAELMKQTFGGFLKSLKGVVPGNAIIELQIEP